MSQANFRILSRIKNAAPLLQKLLPVCGNLRSAQNELRWLNEYAVDIAQRKPSGNKASSLLTNFVSRRAQYEPLQYILGSAFFGELEIRCRPNVLIPRQETADAVTHLVHLLSKSRLLPASLNVVDLCTGTGCIPLLFHNEIYKCIPSLRTSIHLKGVDISLSAVELAEENKSIQLALKQQTESPRSRSLQQIAFEARDIFEDAITTMQGQVDILISNPPYISPDEFEMTTEKSVRDYEPRLALVPQIRDSDGAVAGDGFYPRLLYLAKHSEAQIMLMEVGGMQQAVRVSDMASNQGIWDDIEIWRDEPWALPDGGLGRTEKTGRGVAVRGRGKARSVLAARGEGRRWLGSG